MDRIVVVHSESNFFSGAQIMLRYFLHAAQHRIPLVLAFVETQEMRRIVPEGFPHVVLPSNQKFSIGGFAHQIRSCSNALRLEQIRPTKFHGWTSRDWELTIALAKYWNVPAIGSLHDDPLAPFVSFPRKVMMRLFSYFGLDRVICVSQAVHQRCERAGYSRKKLLTIRNGLPVPQTSGVEQRESNALPVRLGFLGALSERKGLDVFFETLDRMRQKDWTLTVAGRPFDETGERWVNALKDRFSAASWWGRVNWKGWISNQDEFFGSIDILVMPSADFDPFPTVLLEAARAGVPTFATDVGGVREIVVDGKTGWIVDSTQWPVRAAWLLDSIVADPVEIPARGRAAYLHFLNSFTIDKMIDCYSRSYASIEAK